MKFRKRNTGSAILTATKVLDIRRRAASGETQGSLSRLFGVGVGQIGRIVRGEVWQNVPMPDAANASEERLLEMLGIDRPSTSGWDRMQAEAQAKLDKDLKVDRLLDEVCKPKLEDPK